MLVQLAEQRNRPASNRSLRLIELVRLRPIMPVLPARRAMFNVGFRMTLARPAVLMQARQAHLRALVNDIKLLHVNSISYGPCIHRRIRYMGLQGDELIGAMDIISNKAMATRCRFETSLCARLCSGLVIPPTDSESVVKESAKAARRRIITILEGKVNSLLADGRLRADNSAIAHFLGGLFKYGVLTSGMISGVIFRMLTAENNARGIDTGKLDFVCHLMPIVASGLAGYRADDVYVLDYVVEKLRAEIKARNASARIVKRMRRCLPVCRRAAESARTATMTGAAISETMKMDGDKIAAVKDEAADVKVEAKDVKGEVTGI